MVSFHYVSVSQPFSALVLGRLIMLCSVTCLLIAHLDKLCLIYLPAPASLPDCTALNHCSRPDTISQRIFDNLTNQTPIYDWTNPKSLPGNISFYLLHYCFSLLGTRDKWFILWNDFITYCDLQDIWFTLKPICECISNGILLLR